MRNRLIIFLLIALALPVLGAVIAPGAMQAAMLPLSERFLTKALLRAPVERDAKIVVLTIDDGPSSRTDEILTVLERYEATATFFIHTDHIDSGHRADTVRRIIAHGHELGHHMPSDTISITLTNEEFAVAFERSEEVISRYRPPFAPKYFRPAGGLYHAGKMDPSLRRFGYDRTIRSLTGSRRYILASFLPWDAAGATNTSNPDRNNRAAKKYADQLAANIFPGAIIVFHDGDHDGQDARLEATMVSLDRFLRLATEQGYSVTSLSTSLAERERHGLKPTNSSNSVNR